MIEELKEKGWDCGLCSHGKTNGWIAPVVKCDKWARDEMPFLPYMYYSKKYPGTTCEFFRYKYEKTEISEELLDKIILSGKI